MTYLLAYVLGFLAAWNFTSINEDVQLDVPKRLLWSFLWPLIGLKALPMFLRDVGTMRRLGVKKFGGTVKATLRGPR